MLATTFQSCQDPRIPLRSRPSVFDNIDNKVDEEISEEDNDYPIITTHNETVKTSDAMMQDPAMDDAIYWLLSLVSNTLVICDPSLY